MAGFKISSSHVAGLALLLFVVATVSAEMQYGGVNLQRLKRAAPVSGETDGKENVDDLNLAQEVDEEFPVIFNIILWLGISLLIATMAICTAIATMDPGRDSLIYRVTSAQRFKKDN